MFRSSPFEVNRSLRRGHSYVVAFTVPGTGRALGRGSARARPGTQLRCCIHGYAGAARQASTTAATAASSVGSTPTAGRETSRLEFATDNAKQAASVVSERPRCKNPARSAMRLPRTATLVRAGLRSTSAPTPTAAALCSTRVPRSPIHGRRTSAPSGTNRSRTRASRSPVQPNSADEGSIARPAQARTVRRSTASLAAVRSGSRGDPARAATSRRNAARPASVASKPARRSPSETSR